MGKTSFKSKNFNIEEVLELVHKDLCGPIGNESYSGGIYFFFFRSLCKDDNSNVLKG